MIFVIYGNNSMSKILQIDDLDIGTFITIHTGAEFTPIGNFNSKQKMTREKYFSLKGYVLKVMAIELPYVSVNYHVFEKLQNEVIDIRDASLIRLNNEFVVAVDPLFKDDIVEKEDSKSLL